MKAVAVCMFLMLALMPMFYVEATSKQQIDCSTFNNHSPKDAPICVQIYDPICGSDGKTYSNKCNFCTAVMKSDGKIKFAHKGKC